MIYKLPLHVLVNLQTVLDLLYVCWYQPIRGSFRSLR